MSVSSAGPAPVGAEVDVDVSIDYANTAYVGFQAFIEYDSAVIELVPLETTEDGSIVEAGTGDCYDGIDNDGDGETDGDDLECSAHDVVYTGLGGMILEADAVDLPAVGVLRVTKLGAARSASTTTDTGVAAVVRYRCAAAGSTPLTLVPPDGLRGNSTTIGPGGVIVETGLTAGSITCGGATPTPTRVPPPNRFFGSVTLNGAPAPDGTEVLGLIGANVCGSTIASGGMYSYLDVVSDAHTPGCGTDGATVSFTVSGVPAHQTAWWSSGAFTSLNLTAGGWPAVIDIKPGSDPNSINPESKGVIPVAILTTEDFDATTVDADTVRFGPGEAEKAHKRAHVEDADGDGDLDLVLHFRTQDTGIAPGDIEACLTGETFDGQAVEGCDAVVTVPPGS